MSLSNNTAAADASSFIVGMFASRSPVSHTYKTEITDWEFVTSSDLSDDDNVIDILSDSENESTLISVSFVDNRGLKVDDQDYVSLTVVGIRSTYNELADEERKTSKEREQQQDVDEEVEDPEFDDEENKDDLDDELVPWSVCDWFLRQKMRKLGTRAFAKMNKTSKKFAYVRKA